MTPASRRKFATQQPLKPPTDNFSLQSLAQQFPGQITPSIPLPRSVESCLTELTHRMDHLERNMQSLLDRVTVIENAQEATNQQLSELPAWYAHVTALSHQIALLQRANLQLQNQLEEANRNRREGSRRINALGRQIEEVWMYLNPTSNGGLLPPAYGVEEGFYPTF